MKQENKRAYLAPSIKVISVRSERGFDGSVSDGEVKDDDLESGASGSVQDGFFGKRF